jgi:hypothetical protein
MPMWLPDEYGNNRRATDGCAGDQHVSSADPARRPWAFNSSQSLIVRSVGALKSPRCAGASQPGFSDRGMVPAAVGIPSGLSGARSLSEPPGRFWATFPGIRV